MDAQLVTTLSSAEMRVAMRSWFIENARLLDDYRVPRGETFEEHVAQQQELVKLLFDASWSRWGWPTNCGGLGGGSELRAVFHDELHAAHLIFPLTYGHGETMGPPLLEFAPDLAARYLPGHLDGSEIVAQGFSEPDAGSDLAALRTRATDAGDYFLVSGQKIWTTLGQCSTRAMVLVRTGAADSRHRGLTMLWMDLHAPGVTVNPIMAASGVAEFAEMFFDDVRVAKDQVIGNVGDGWRVAMHLMQFERGMYAWSRQAGLHAALETALATVLEHKDAQQSNAGRVGAAYVRVAALRARSRKTVLRLAAEEKLGAELSIDKALLSQAEQECYDAIRLLLWPAIEFDDDPAARAVREKWFYSRAASIFGGAVEIQRDIIAEHVLGLPKGR